MEETYTIIYTNADDYAPGTNFELKVDYADVDEDGYPVVYNDFVDANSRHHILNTMERGLFFIIDMSYISNPGVDAYHALGLEILLPILGDSFPGCTCTDDQYYACQVCCDAITETHIRFLESISAD